MKAKSKLSIRAAMPAEAQQGSTIALTAPVALTAGAATADGKPAKLPSFKITAYTGSVMNLEGFYYPVIVELSGVKARQRIPILLDHEQSKIIGMSDSVKVSSDAITIEGTITAEDANAQTVLTNARNGFDWQASIGASPDRREFLEAGKTAKVNGQTVNGPCVIVRAATLKETSFVSIGADPNAAASVAASHKLETENMAFTEWLKAKGFDPAAISAEQTKFLQAAFDAEVKAKADAGVKAKAPAPEPTKETPVDDAAADLKAARIEAAAEFKRMSAIRKLAVKHDDIAAKAIEEGWTAEKTELEVLRAARSSTVNAPHGGGSHGGGAALNARAVEAAMCLTAMLPEKFVADSIPAGEREQVMNAATSGALRGFTLHSLMAACIHAAGGWYSGSQKSNDFIRAAFEAERSIKAMAGGFSTVSLSSVLSNVANKTLLASYTAQATTWREIAAVRNHTDFKVRTAYRLDATGAFKKVGPDGELKHVGLTDTPYTNQLETYGAMLALTRQAIINDDLGVFLEIPASMGRLCAVRIEEAVYVLLLSNPSSFFGTGNGNYFEGAGTTLQITQLAVAARMFRNQVDANGKPILTMPKILLLPTTLEVTGAQLFSDAFFGVTALGSTSAAALAPVSNPYKGLYRPVVSPYLNNTSITDQDGHAITGQSDTAWYLFSDPAVRAAIAVAFLNGQQTPTIENAETDFQTLGMQWRAYCDFGVGMEDPSAAIKSKGAA